LTCVLAVIFKCDRHAKSLQHMIAEVRKLPDCIEAFTDDSGEAAENKKVSLKRANAVKDRLVRAGVPADRIIAVGAGADHPIARNDTEEGGAKNRRIDLSDVPK
jgi:outer membrane protein OmpA-like peptidoglycan-associated protein